MISGENAQIQAHEHSLYGVGPCGATRSQGGVFLKNPEQMTLAGEMWPFGRRPRAFAPPGARGLRIAISRRDLADPRR